MNDFGDNGDGGGNTITPPLSKRSTQCLHWCFTYNNYSPSDLEILETCFKYLCFKYCFQEETGENGTRHLQGVISLKKRARWSEFGLPKDIHWEVCRHVTKSYAYCSKIETRTGNVFSLNFTVPYVENIEKLYGWQSNIIKLLSEEPDKRTINWYHEPDGGAGKTTFQKYIFTHFNGVVILSGKGSDMKNGVVNYLKTTGGLPKIVLINIPRSVDSDFISYQGIEEIKDMFFFSGKYEGGMVCGASPHVLVFANRTPITEKMSLNRWSITNLKEV